MNKNYRAGVAVLFALLFLVLSLPMNTNATTDYGLDPDRIVSLPNDIEGSVECGNDEEATCAVTITLSATSTVSAIGIDGFWELEDTLTEETIYYDDGVTVVEAALGGFIVRQAPGEPCSTNDRLRPTRFLFRRFLVGIDPSDFVVNPHDISPPDCKLATEIARMGMHKSALKTKVAENAIAPTPWPSPTAPCPGCSTPDECPDNVLTSCNSCAGSGEANPYIDYSCYGCGFSNFKQVIEGVVDRNVNPAYKQFFMTGTSAGFTGTVFYTTCEDRDTFSPSGSDIVSPGLGTNLCPAKRFRPTRAGCDGDSCGIAHFLQGQVNITLRDANPGTLLHEMFHAFMFTRFTNTEREELMECARDVVMNWVTMCSRSTYPPGPDGQHTYRAMCIDINLKAPLYAVRHGEGTPVFVEEMLSLALHAAASCTGGQGCRNIPPELVAVFAMLDEFLSCSVGVTPLSCP